MDTGAEFSVVTVAGEVVALAVVAVNDLEAKSIRNLQAVTNMQAFLNLL